MEKYLWHEESGASRHVENDTSGMNDCNCVHSYIKIGHGKYMYSSRIGKKKITIVQANGSTLDLIMFDCI
jgi:3-dehydroquinate synthase class II